MPPTRLVWILFILETWNLKNLLILVTIVARVADFTYSMALILQQGSKFSEPIKWDRKDFLSYLIGSENCDPYSHIKAME